MNDVYASVSSRKNRGEKIPIQVAQKLFVPEKQAGVLLSCQHCLHVWVYAGKREFCTTCPNCRYKVNVKKRRVGL